jgi:hypothetical protein
MALALDELAGSTAAGSTVAAACFSETGAGAVDFSFSRSEATGAGAGSVRSASSSMGWAAEGAAQGISAALRDAQKPCCFFFLDLVGFCADARAEPAAG